MISKEQLKEILQMLKLPEDQISEAVDGEEEVSIELPKAKLYTDKQIADMKAAHLNDKKQGFYDAGKEFAIKEMKEKEGLDFEGKDYDAFLEAYRAKILADANINPTEARKRHEEEKSALQKQLTEEKNKALELQKQLSDIGYERKLLASFPKGETILPQDDLLMLIKSRLTESKDGDNEIYSYKGAALRDDEQNYLNLEQSISHLFQTEGWLKQTTEPNHEQKKGGLGLGDTGQIAGSYKDFDEFAADLEKRGIPVGSDAANKLLKAAVEKNPKLVGQ